MSSRDLISRPIGSAALTVPAPDDGAGGDDAHGVSVQSVSALSGSARDADARLADTTFAADVLASVATASPTAVVLIDGPSGAGKSTLADQVLAAWPGERRPTLVRLDDIYPGWGGLDAGILHLEQHVLAPRRAGRAAAWQRFDWTVEAPLEWHIVDPTLPLIIEGCGALARAHAALSDVRVWLDAEDHSRKRRAIARDGDRFLAHWDEWQQEWESYLRRDNPEEQATLRLFAPS